jgi:tellurite resistance protein TerC
VIAGIPIWIWCGFLAFVLAMLALDLGVFHRRAHVVGVREALAWSAVWIGLALAFNLGVCLLWDRIYPASEYANSEAGLAFLSGYLIEKALSVDNIFVFLVVFAYFDVPPRYQHRVLFWGIIGALVFRASFIAAGAALLKSLAWMTLVFGLFLVVTAVKMITLKDRKIDPDKNPLVRLCRRLFPVTPDFVGQRFFTRVGGRLWATPLFVTLVTIEFTDIVFAVDSIPAIFAITSDPFIVFTSNVFAILGLRALFFAVSGLVSAFHYLSYGLASILAFVGCKMGWTFIQHATGDPGYKFPIPWSLGIIAGLLAVSILASLLSPPKAPRHAVPAPPGGVEEEEAEVASRAPLKG